MPVFNLLEYSNSYSMALRSLSNYYRDEVHDSANENNDANNFRIYKNKVNASKSFEYKTKLTESTPNNDYNLDAEIVDPLNFSVILEISRFTFN